MSTERAKAAPAVPGKRPALGRGLSALIPSGPATPPRGFTTVALDEVSADQKQPRRYWNPKSLEELTQSVKAKGIIQPILVRRLAEGGYRIVAGERRFRAARDAGLTRVPVIIREVSDADAFELALIENIQREDLNPIEEAEAYQRLLTEHGLTQEALALRLGKERSTIANALRLLKLPGEVREHLASGSLTAGHAKVLLGLDDRARMVELTQAIATRGLSIRDVERMVLREREPEGEKGPPPAPAHRLQVLARKLEKRLHAPVELKVRASGAGELVVRFDDEEGAVRLLETLIAGADAPEA